MALTDLDKENVRSAAENITQCANAMRIIFDDLINTMNMVGTDDVFRGEGATNLMANFNTTKTNFDTYTNNIANFSATLLALVDEEEAGEKQHAARANDLPTN